MNELFVVAASIAFDIHARWNICIPLYMICFLQEQKTSGEISFENKISLGEYSKENLILTYNEIMGMRNHETSYSYISKISLSFIKGGILGPQCFALLTYLDNLVFCKEVLFELELNNKALDFEILLK